MDVLGERGIFHKDQLELIKGSLDASLKGINPNIMVGTPSDMASKPGLLLLCKAVIKWQLDRLLPCAGGRGFD